jgi:hypothetical protein
MRTRWTSFPFPHSLSPALSSFSLLHYTILLRQYFSPPPPLFAASPLSLWALSSSVTILLSSNYSSFLWQYSHLLSGWKNLLLHAASKMLIQIFCGKLQFSHRHHKTSTLTCWHGLGWELQSCWSDRPVRKVKTSTLTCWHGLGWELQSCWSDRPAREG